MSKSRKEKKNVCPFCFHEAKAWTTRSVEGKGVRMCPRCKSVVPQEYDECDEVFPIVVVGPTRAGKTHFLTVLAHELAEVGLWKDYWGVDWVIRQGVQGDEDEAGQGDPDSENGADNLNVLTQVDQFVAFRKTLYALTRRDESLLDGTRAGTVGATCALVLSVKYEGGTNRLKEPGKPKKILVTFSDTAGETFKEDGWSDVISNYPVLDGHAKAIIAVLDPLELRTLRAEAREPGTKGLYVDYGIAPDDDSKMPTVRTSAVLSIPGLKKLKKKIPLAVCLTKTDALGALGKIDEQALLLQSQGGLTGDDDSWKTSGKLDIRAIKAVSDQTRRFVEMQDGGNKATKLFDQYKYNCYFAVDALGRSFHDGRLADSPAPRRILDPLLWILWQYRLCGGR